MPQPSDGTSPADFARACALFDRTWEIPPAERAAFVHRQADGDEQLAAHVLELLASAMQALPNGSRDEVRKWLSEHVRTARPAPRSEAQHRVQSTATDELMQRLAKAPRLDAMRFAVEGEVGKGGMGVVYRLHDQDLNRRLAMKVLLDRGTPQDAEEQ